MKIDYISSLEHAKEICDYFRRRIIYIYFENGSATESIIPNYCESEAYQRYFYPVKKCVELCRFLNPKSIADRADNLYKTVACLEDSTKVRNLSDFNINFDVLKTTLSLVSLEMLSFLSSFDSDERERINEAIHTFFENCNYSCIAMSVSAVESRLFKLMSLTNPNAVTKLGSMTLGQLITEYIENKEAYKNVVPNKHEALLKLCNTYRIFSVHPKKEDINASIASSILNLSLLFLTDQNTMLETVKAKLVAE